MGAARCKPDYREAIKAVAIDRYKGDLTLRDMLEPVPGLGELVVAIAATSVNPIDFKLRDGEFKAILPQTMPLILGLDLAGTVIATGAGVSRFKIGDEVFARPADDHIGTFAERIAVAEADLALNPKSLDMTEAAALPLTALTAWQVLVERAQTWVVFGGTLLAMTTFLPARGFVARR